MAYPLVLLDPENISNEVSFFFQDTVSAVDLASKALEIKPKSFEAFYARARAKRDDRWVLRGHMLLLAFSNNCCS